MTRVDARDAVFEALSDPTRRRLLAIIADQGTATATELARRLPVTRQAVSKHLGTLAAARLIAAEREGREVRYRPTPAPMSDAVEWMAGIGAQWDARLDALSRSLERGAAAPKPGA